MLDLRSTFALDSSLSAILRLHALHRVVMLTATQMSQRTVYTGLQMADAVEPKPELDGGLGSKEAAQACQSVIKHTVCAYTRVIVRHRRAQVRVWTLASIARVKHVLSADVPSVPQSLGVMMPLIPAAAHELAPPQKSDLRVFVNAPESCCCT
eukprot:1145561-Pelagomonas_calceolata.AAC.5